MAGTMPVQDRFLCGNPACGGSGLKGLEKPRVLKDIFPVSFSKAAAPSPPRLSPHLGSSVPVLQSHRHAALPAAASERQTALEVGSLRSGCLLAGLCGDPSRGQTEGLSL